MGFLWGLARLRFSYTLFGCGRGLGVFFQSRSLLSKQQPAAVPTFRGTCILTQGLPACKFPYVNQDQFLCDTGSPSALPVPSFGLPEDSDHTYTPR